MIKMKRDLMEGIGLLILLLSFGLQYFSEDLKEDEYIAPLIHMNDNIIHLAANDIDLIEYLTYPENHPKDSTLNEIKNRYFNLSYWQHIEQSLKDSKKQGSTFTRFYIMFYIIGSLMIVFPKIFSKSRIFKD